MLPGCIGSVPETFRSQHDQAESSQRKGDGGDKGLWERRKLLGMMFEDEERFGIEGCGRVSGEGEMGREPDQRPLDAVDRDVDVGAVGLLEDARMWMEECEDSHAECAALKSVLLPTRILQVHAYEDTFTVKLVEFTESRNYGSYTALSYVWGTRPTLRLLRSNRSAFLENIAYEDLPKTMQDAVRATCALGANNLWIDALCIVQDDDTDKEIELPHMNEYYQHASAVISASGASDAHMGFLADQPSKSEIYAKARARTVFTHAEFGDVPYRIPFRTSVGITTCILDIQPSLYNHDAEPINKRGWTLQESALAKRLLVFPSVGGLIARCEKGVRCFGDVLGDPFHEEGEFGGLTAVDEDGDGSPANALRLLSGDGDGMASKRSSIVTTPSEEGEAVFEAIAMPKKRSSLTREERITQMHQERERRTSLMARREANTSMMKELENVITLRPKKGINGATRITSI
jgi:hypothetical protein